MAKPLRKNKAAHLPVLLKDVVEGVGALEKLDGYYIDGTFGRGGHAKAVLDKYPKIKMIGLDCDHEAVEYAQTHFADEAAAGRFEIIRKNFSDFSEALAGRPLSGILLDLGVSSPQLDEGHRGFSFMRDGPLDMRMDQSQAETAAEIVNTWGEIDLITLFKEYGEIYKPTKVVSRILERREEQPFKTTGELAELIERTDGWKQKGYHPATNYFMALRIRVNDELGRLQKVIPEIFEKLIPGGRILVITFHSLEDRIVKELFREFEDTKQGLRVNKNVIQADWAEKKQNPRARSAKLRIFEKGAVKEKKRRDRENYIK
ncbi:MAG: 16S rRNA (cytosine(1402)-N(4))-methyltransferase RsmH [Bdellovibrionota bacterium]|mgnify:CR=1 FL=1